MAAGRKIIWTNVVTVMSAAILIGAEVFGAAFAGGWAIAGLFGLGEYGGYILQGIFFVAGLAVLEKVDADSLGDSPLVPRVRGDLLERARTDSRRWSHDPVVRKKACTASFPR